MVKGIFKFCIAFALIYWLVSNGSLDFSLLFKVFNHPYYLVTGLSLVLFAFPLTALRWKLILELKTEKKLNYPPVLGLTWVGAFFSTILPGGVTGDLIKVLYANKLDKNLTKGYLLISVFVDRIFGLISMLIIQGVISLIFYHDLIALSPKIKPLIFFNFSLFIGILFFASSMFLSTNIQNKILLIVDKIPVINSKLNHALSHVWLIGKDRLLFIKCLTLTLISNSSIILAFYILALPFINQPLPFQYALSFIPLGLITTMIPISPQGLGVGHAMFQELFSYFHINNGASLFNIYFIISVSVNLSGVIPYLFLGGKPKESEMEDLETQAQEVLD